MTMKQGVRILVYLVLCFSSVSCINLRYNYVGVPHRQSLSDTLNVTYMQFYERQKIQVNNHADSLVKTVVANRRKRYHMRAAELNQLYTSFGEQLNIDRYFNGLLRKGRLKHDSLSALQSYAGSQLLLSASLYNRMYKSSRIIRRALNRGNKSNNVPRNTLRKSSNFLYSPSVRKIVTNGRRESIYPTDSILGVLPRTNILRVLQNQVGQFGDQLNSLAGNCFAFLGKSFFGRNSAVNTLKINNKQLADTLLVQLQPFDIVLEKSTSYLTNQVIPGYFTHASLWLGLKNRRKFDFKPDRLWKDREVSLHDRAMAEAITTGVRMSSLREYAVGKTYVIIRFLPLDSTQKTAVLSNTLKHMGKGYDFNFDIESSDVVNCTELIYLSFDFINWETQYSLGRYTIYPDDILRTALKDCNFRISAIIENGKVYRNPDASKVFSLIDE